MSYSGTIRVRKSTLCACWPAPFETRVRRIVNRGKKVERASLERGVVFQDYGLFPWMTAGENIITH